MPDKGDVLQTRHRLKKLQKSVEVEQVVKIFITPEDSAARHIANVASKVTDACNAVCGSFLQVFDFANC